MANRNYALDLLRGLTIALMIVVNNPGDWKEMFTVLRHAEWHGFLGADIVFPLFLFVAGYAAALKIDRLYAPLAANGPHCASALTLVEREIPPFYLPLLRRAAILFLIGMFLNAWPLGLLPGTEFSFEKLRVFGVLQRIAICVLIAGVVLRRFLTVKGLVSVLILIAAAYEICMRVPLVQGADILYGRSFELKDNFARFIDTSLLPASMLYKVQKIPFDPEGLFTSLTAVITFLLGGLTFRLSTGMTETRRQRFFLALLLSTTGLLMALVEPINKNLWTLPYVLLTGAAGVILLAALEKINTQEPKLLYRLSIPFASMGRNPLMIYVLSGVVGKTLALWKTPAGVSIKTMLYQGLAHIPLPGKGLSLLYSVILLVLMALLAAAMKNLRLSAR
ncbi:MAG: heparan-alpha-glucosaminide N-acetyltransferase domain-containing protein [Turneriella sp.]